MKFDKSVFGVCEYVLMYDKYDCFSDDWVFCLLEYFVKGVRYEIVDMISFLMISIKVVLMGYGCI